MGLGFQSSSRVGPPSSVAPSHNNLPQTSTVASSPKSLPSEPVSIPLPIQAATSSCLPNIVISTAISTEVSECIPTPSNQEPNNSSPTINNLFLGDFRSGEIASLSTSLSLPFLEGAHYENNAKKESTQTRM